MLSQYLLDPIGANKFSHQNIIQLLLITLKFSKNAWSCVGCFAIEKTDLVTSLLFFISLTPVVGQALGLRPLL